jgi:hypothetical protein
MKKQSASNLFTLPVFVYLLLCFFIPSRGFAQDKSIKDLYALRTPNYCLRPTGQVLGKVPDNMRDPNKNDGTWVVYADRDEDSVYLDKNLTKFKTTVDFLSAFYVLEETENAVRIISFQQKDIRIKVKDKVKFNPEEATEVGWMPKSKLLLWQTSLIDAQTGFLRKAVPVQKLSVGQTDSKVAAEKLRVGKGVCDFYKSPYIPKYDPTSDVNFFKYLFIFKEENNRLLLGKINEVTVGSIQTYIYGWVPKGQVHQWNNAVCLRVNYDEKAVKERVSKGIDVSFFRTPEEAERFGKGDFTTKGASIEFAKDGQGQYESSYILGFPIISEEYFESKGVLKTGYITNLKGPDGKNIFTVQDKAKIDSVVAQVKSNMDNVNVLFVLDGALRQSYFDDIASAVENLVQIGSRDFSSTRYSWGAVIYNDANCPDQMIQKINWEDKKANFVSSLRRQVGSTPPACRNDRKSGAPVISALKEAARMFPSSRTNNIVILVGTSGEANQETSVSSLVKTFVSKNISLRAFQVNNMGGAIYDDFFDQSRELMVKSAQESDQNLSKLSNSYATIQKVDVKPRDNSFVLVNTSNPGEITYCADGQKISEGKMRELLVNFLVRGQKRLEQIKSIFDDGKFKDTDYTVDQRKSVLSALLGVQALSEDVISVLSGLDNIQLFIESYTVLRTDPSKLSNPLLVRALFMSSEEFNRLKDIVERMDNASGEGSRENLRNAIIQLQLMYIGGNLKPNQFSIGEIMKMATGVPSNNKALKYTPDDILDAKKVPESCINLLREGFRKMSANLDLVERDLKQIYKNDKYYEDEVFYWIPESFIKLNEDCGVQKETSKGKKK